MVVKTGKYLGHGGFKLCYAAGRHKVVLVGAPSDANDLPFDVYQRPIQAEYDNLIALAGYGFRVPATELVEVRTDHSTEPGLLQERLTDVWHAEHALESIRTFLTLVKAHRIHIDDLQWMTDRKGYLVIHDPMGVEPCNCLDGGTCHDTVTELEVAERLIIRYDRTTSKLKTHNKFRNWMWRAAPNTNLTPYDLAHVELHQGQSIENLRSQQIRE
jgi:hypothetical protein